MTTEIHFALVSARQAPLLASLNSKEMEEVHLTYGLADELRIPQLTGLQMRHPSPSLLLKALAGICHR